MKRIILALILSLWAWPGFAAEYQVLKFTATWCGPCQRMAPNWRTQRVRQVLKDRDIHVVGVDVDRYPKLRDYYKATTIPLVILVWIDDNKKHHIVSRAQMMSEPQLFKFLQAKHPSDR